MIRETRAGRSLEQVSGDDVDQWHVRGSFKAQPAVAEPVDRVDPGVDESHHAFERVAHGSALDVRARCVADRVLAVLMDDNLEAPDEYIRVMAMERPPAVALTIQELVGIVGSFVGVALDVAPDLADLDDPQSGLVTVRKERPERKGQGSLRRLIEREGIIRPEVEDDAVALEQQGCAPQVVLQGVFRGAHPGSAGLLVASRRGFSETRLRADRATDNASA